MAWILPITSYLLKKQLAVQSYFAQMKKKLHDQTLFVTKITVVDLKNE